MSHVSYIAAISEIKKSNFVFIFEIIFLVMPEIFSFSTWNKCRTKSLTDIYLDERVHRGPGIRISTVIRTF